jgi:hypothetical protein
VTALLPLDDPPFVGCELHLRFRGIYLCRGSGPDIDCLIRLLRLLAQMELAAELVPGADRETTRITGREIEARLGLAKEDEPPWARLRSMTSADVWGLTIKLGTAWYVEVRPEIARFRDVQTAEDCIAILDDLEAALQLGTRKYALARYYHVRLVLKEAKLIQYLLDLSREALESQILSPYAAGTAIVKSGMIIPVSDLAKIQIMQTDKVSADLPRPRPRPQRSSPGFTYVKAPGNWRPVISAGTDVTGAFITGPPRHASQWRQRRSKLHSSRSRRPTSVVRLSRRSAARLGRVLST